MAHVEGTFGAMLQGVSQQPDRIRTAGQVTAQDNYDSDVATGLTSRAGSLELATLTGSTADTKFTNFGFNGRNYIAGHSSGSLMLWRISGTDITSVTIAGGTAYSGPDMVFTPDVSNDRVLCLNRDTVVGFSTSAAGRPFHAGVVTCLGGQFSRTYKVTITAGASTITFDYSTLDGSAPAHAAGTSSDKIAESLVTAFNALSLPAAFTGMTVSRSDSTIEFRHNVPLTIVTDDGGTGATIRSITDIADDATTLPKTASHGHIVLVRGGSSEDDDYYLRFESDTTTTDGSGFGDPGVWRETANPLIPNAWVSSTLPHTITFSSDGTSATFATAAWLPRRAGDENTNPTPDFVGHPIRDMLITEERLAFVANGGFFASRTGSPLDLWGQSATVQSASDPIGIRSNSSVGSALDWIIPFDRNLLVVSDPGRAQFVVSGGLNPSTTSMVLTTEYDVASGVRPVSTGRTIVMPYRVGSFVGVNEFFTNDVVSTNTADPITAVQDEYIRGAPTTLHSADNYNRFAITADGDDKSIWVYRYLWGGQERLQAAWYRYVFTDAVRSFFFDETHMYVIISPAGETASRVIRLDLNKTKDNLDLNRTEDPIEFHITLDRIHHLTVASNQVTVPFNGALVVQRTGCTAPGLLAPATVTNNNNGTFTYALNASQCPNAASVTLGQPVLRTMTPTTAFSRDRSGAVMSNVKMYIRSYLIHLTDSGNIVPEIANPYRPTYVQDNNRFPLDDEALDPNRTGVLTDSVVRVPVRELTTRHSLSVTSTDIRPTTIVEIEFEADLRNARRRV